MNGKKKKEGPSSPPVVHPQEDPNSASEMIQQPSQYQQYQQQYEGNLPI